MTAAGLGQRRDHLIAGAGPLYVTRTGVPAAGFNSKRVCGQLDLTPIFLDLIPALK
jgi:hypothetical protein